MRYGLFFILAAIACRTVAGRVSPHANLIAITHATVITGTSGPPLRDATVIVQGRRILSVDTGSRATTPPAAQQIDGTGKYVLPGLWDMHVHLVVDGEGALPQYVQHGVTGVRDMGGQFEIIQQFRSDIASGRITGPRILSPGPMLESPTSMAGLPQFASKSETARLRLDRVMIADTQTARHVVDSLAALGVDFIKSRSYASVDVYWEIARSARRHRLAFAGHAPFELTVDPVAFADSGNESLEHWYYPGNLTTLPSAQGISALWPAGFATAPCSFRHSRPGGNIGLRTIHCGPCSRVRCSAAPSLPCSSSIGTPMWRLV